MIRRYRSRSDAEAPDQGFTVVELLVVMVIMGVIGSVFVTSMIVAMQTHRRTDAKAQANNVLTVAMRTMTRQVRAAAPLEQVDANQATMMVYTAGSKQRHTITYDATTKRVTDQVCSFASLTATTCTASTRVLATSIEMGTTPVFTPMRKDGTPATTAGQTAYVDLALKAKPRETPSIDVTTTVYLRNFKG